MTRWVLQVIDTPKNYLWKDSVGGEVPITSLTKKGIEELLWKLDAGLAIRLKPIELEWNEHTNLPRGSEMDFMENDYQVDWNDEGYHGFEDRPWEVS